MATVTGMTAAAMQAIRDNTVTSAAFDSANHLILTKYDGTQIDGGVLSPATTALVGPVELATAAETQAGTDATRAVTPAGLASLSGYRVQIMGSNQIAESAPPASWPYGVSLQNCTTSSGWSLMNGFGTVTTFSIMQDRTYQLFSSSNGGTSPVMQWMRTYHSTTGGGGWTAWSQVAIGDMGVSHIDTAKLATDLPASYPSGMSMMALTSANISANWPGLTAIFGSGATGIVHTERPHTGNVTQYFLQSGASSVTPGMAIRNGDASGWSAWRQVLTDPGSWTTYTPTWTTSSGLALPSLGNAVTACRAFKLGRKVDVQFAITFGSTTNFGSGATGSDNWRFSLPPAWPAARTNDEGIGFMEMYHDKYNFGLARVKLVTTTAFGLGISSAFVGSSSSAPVADTDIGGDVDSISPFSGGTNQGLWTSGDILRGSFSYESAA